MPHIPQPTSTRVPLSEWVTASSTRASSGSSCAVAPGTLHLNHRWNPGPRGPTLRSTVTNMSNSSGFSSPFFTAPLFLTRGRPRVQKCCLPASPEGTSSTLFHHRQNSTPSPEGSCCSERAAVPGHCSAGHAMAPAGRLGYCTGIQHSLQQSRSGNTRQGPRHGPLACMPNGESAFWWCPLGTPLWPARACLDAAACITQASAAAQHCACVSAGQGTDEHSRVCHTTQMLRGTHCSLAGTHPIQGPPSALPITKAGPECSMCPQQSDERGSVMVKSQSRGERVQWARRPYLAGMAQGK